MADGLRRVGAVNAINRAAEIKRTRTHGVPGPARHEARQIGLARDHFRRRGPVRPFRLERDAQQPVPLEAVASDAYAVAQRYVVGLNEIKETMLGIDDDRAGRLVGAVEHGLAAVNLRNHLRFRRRFLAWIGILDGRRHLAQIPRRAVLRESADRRHENSEGGKRRPGHPFDHAAGSAVGMARLMPLMLARVLARGPAVRGEIFSAHRNWLRRALHDQDAVRHETEIAAHRLEVLAQLRRMLDRGGGAMRAGVLTCWTIGPLPSGVFLAPPPLSARAPT